MIKIIGIGLAILGVIVGKSLSCPPTEFDRCFDRCMSIKATNPQIDPERHKAICIEACK